jgi:hypothetical protein
MKNPCQFEENKRIKLGSLSEISLFSATMGNRKNLETGFKINKRFKIGRQENYD